MFRLMCVDDSQGVELTSDGVLRADYGRKHIETTVDNVDYTQVTGPHRWYTAVGLRLSFARGDDGVTFGTNHHLGLCIAFVKPVRKVIGLKDHTALWVSVADPEGLAAAIEEQRASK